jgi:molecular chaperone GrpE
MAKIGKKKTDKNQELENQLKRALADYANLQKRMEGERRELSEYFKSIFAFKFLPVLDSLEAALEAVGREGVGSAEQGLELAVGQFKKVLKNEGVEEIKTDDRFNPSLHEAIEVVPGKQDNKIVEVVARGYKLGKKILRPAKVKVEKKEEKVKQAKND